MKTRKDLFFIAEAFYLANLRQSAAMSLLASEARVDESAHYIQRKLAAYDACAETKHVTVIMLTRLVCRVGVAAKCSAHALQLIRGHARAHAATANQDAYIRTPALHTASDEARVIRIIIRLFSIVRAEVLYLVARRAQFFDHALVERIPSMICADGDSHIGRYFFSKARA